MAIRTLFLEPGRVFGRWTVLREGAKRKTRWHYRCRCLCGTVKDVDACNLLHGLTLGCGCQRGVWNREHATHRLSGTREYTAWTEIKRRCYNPKAKSYRDYGARGIVMCDEWLHDPVRFVRDMGPCPSGYSIERNDNDGPYSPNNCRWATHREQALNTRRNGMLAFNGTSKRAHEWARDLGLTTTQLTKRLRRGWPLEKALTLSKRTSQTRLTNRYLDFLGERRCVSEWARVMGIEHGVILARLRIGWSVEKTLTQPVQSYRRRHD